MLKGRTGLDLPLGKGQVYDSGDNSENLGSPLSNPATSSPKAFITRPLCGPQPWCPTKIQFASSHLCLHKEDSCRLMGLGSPTEVILPHLLRSQAASGQEHEGDLFVTMNSSGERRQEAAGPRGRRVHRREQDRDVQLSKALSYVLRHGALKLGLPMGADGFVPLGALLQLPQFHSFSVEDVQRVVDTNGKQRFALQPGDPSTGPLIRANQGHSLQVPELELMPIETPQALPLTLVHGTFWKHWPSILLKGLSCRGRTHIHLAPGLPGDSGVISGMRSNCEVAVFINGPLALAGNADGVLLPKYFKEALQLCPTRKPLSLADDKDTEGQRAPSTALEEER
ncbi:tRNA 2'-phosphotransferase 1 isoform X3 [Nycticebus coucang]|uniref:tRNA 2'-phosphotransferase 1 isoform X3 n=1 Tax=Nycticebus coucang TaxID=9470 RepID=UPI00234E2348|nr:tRNA 2'-phosphotransferase 1 isoform X3 [Nycticebus coucang]